MADNYLEKKYEQYQVRKNLRDKNQSQYEDTP